MDFIGTVLNLAPLATLIRNRGARNRELSVCVRNALYRACTNQRGLQDPSEVADALFSPVTDSELGEWFVELKLDSDHQEMWKKQLRLIFNESKFIDPNQFELDKLFNDFGQYLKEEIVQCAGKHGSFLFNEVSLHKSFSELDEDRPSSLSYGFPNNSNFWTLPVLPQTAPRTELDAVEESLKENAVVVVSGGVGTGKTVIARLLAERMKPKGEAVKWWLDASSEESLMSSCEALLSATRAHRGPDVFNSVKGFLASTSDWLVVVDDLIDVDLFSKIIPGMISTGTVIVTTRQQTSGKFGPEIRLRRADDSVLYRICHLVLSSEKTSSSLNDLVEFCEGNPLAMTTICRYLNFTGMSTDDLIEQLHISPVAALSQGSGVRDDDSFFRITQSAIERFPQDNLSFLVLLISSIAGGYALPHQIFAEILKEDLARILISIHELQSIGLIDSRESQVSCSRLVANIVRGKIDSTRNESLRERIIYSIVRPIGLMEGESLRSMGLALLEVANSQSLSIQPARKSVLTIVNFLINKGVFATSQQLLERLEALPDNNAETIGHINIFKAITSLHVGNYSTAIRESQYVIDLMESEVRHSDIRASAYVVQAWSMENLGDRVAARRAARRASLCAPSDANVSRVSEHFSISLLTAAEQVEEYLKLGQDESLIDDLRALYYCRASRSLVSLGRAKEAVECARRAMDLDLTAGNDGSHFYARDLNDLGNALIESDELEQAEGYLLESLRLYCQDSPAEALAALPRLHLGRLYTLRAFSVVDKSTSDKRLHTASGYLKTVLDSLRTSAPRSPDTASILFALSDTIVSDHKAAISLLREALDIDREIYGDGHVEVAIDISKLMERLILTEDAVQAIREYALIKSYVQFWEIEHPQVALMIVSFHLIAWFKVSGKDRYFESILSHVQRLLDNPHVGEKTSTLVRKLISFSD